MTHFAELRWIVNPCIACSRGGEEVGPCPDCLLPVHKTKKCFEAHKVICLQVPSPLADEGRHLEASLWPQRAAEHLTGRQSPISNEKNIFSMAPYETGGHSYLYNLITVEKWSADRLYGGARIAGLEGFEPILKAFDARVRKIIELLRKENRIFVVLTPAAMMTLSTKSFGVIILQGISLPPPKWLSTRERCNQTFF